MEGKFFLLSALIICTFLLFGCNTIKGTAAGAANGAKQDLEGVKKADGWMKKNLW